MYGATIGKLAIAGVPLTTNQACCACTPYEGIYNLYLFYFLMEEKDNFTQMGFGGAQPNISKDRKAFIPCTALRRTEKNRKYIHRHTKQIKRRGLNLVF